MRRGSDGEWKHREPDGGYHDVVRRRRAQKASNREETINWKFLEDTGIVTNLNTVKISKESLQFAGMYLRTKQGGNEMGKAMLQIQVTFNKRKKMCMNQTDTETQISL